MDIQVINRENYRNSNLLIVFGITLMAILGVSSIAPAIPNVAEALGISHEVVGLLITFFTLPSVLLTPILGMFADRLGRKKILIPSLFLFAIAGFWCGFARDFNHLLILRFLQGMGAAALGTLNLTIIGDLYSGDDLPKAMGYNGAVTSVGTAIFPIIGGAMGNLSWYFPFFLPIVAVIIGILVIFMLKLPESKQDQEIRKYLRNSFKNMGSRRMICLFISSIAVFIMLYGAILTYFPILIDQLYNLSPFIISVSPFFIGLIISSLSISASITSGLLGRITKRVREKYLIIFSFILYGVPLLIIQVIPSLILYIIPLMIFGIAQGLNVPSIQTLIAENSPMEQRAIIMSMNGMFTYLGQSLGPILMGLTFGLWGIGAPFTIGFVISLFIFGTLLILLK